MNWETVATSMLTSGGILFAAYKIWFQRRLEDHKLSLQNNGKLFEIEIKGLEEFGKIIQESLNTDLGIPAKLPETEVFIMKSYENHANLKGFITQNSHTLSKDLTNRISSLLKTLSELQKSSKLFASPNSSYCGGRYNCYNKLPELLLAQSGRARSKTIEAYEAFKAEIYSRAGR